MFPSIPDLRVNLRITLFIILFPFILPVDLAEGQGSNRKGGFGKLFKRKTTPIEALSPDDEKAFKLKEAVLRSIPENRHFREVLAEAIVIAYKQKKYRSLWNRRQLPERLYQALSSQVVRHGIPEIMVLDPNGLEFTTRGSPVNSNDLSYSVAIADAGAMVKFGLVKDAIWPEWNTGDKPGETRIDPVSIAGEILYLASQDSFDPSLVVDLMAPRNWIYRELQNSYIVARRAMIYSDRIPPIPNPVIAGIAKPGQSYEHAPAIAEALAVRGFLKMPPEDRLRLESMTKELTAALKAYQRSRGLVDDGIMGPGTWKRLGANPATTYRKTTVNLQRARLLPDDFGQRHIIVNIPSAELFAFEKKELVLTMKIVHGKNKEQQHTPIFRDVMREVVFAPYWNVPTSISVNEIFPKLLEDPNYLNNRSYEIVDRFYDDATVFELNEETMAKLGAGELYLRQRPIEGNALGKVKFLLPNRFNVYLHDTPSKQGFAMEDRAQSHGCIRIESPPKMAEWILGWETDRIQKAMASTFQIRQPMNSPINVFITYFTSFPRPSETSPGQFVLSSPRDVYQLDSKDEEILMAYIP